MSTIVGALKAEGSDFRVSGGGDRWLVWDEAEAAWRVYERRYGAKTTTTVVITTDERRAVACLLGNEG